jgi:hypothetical protein
MYQKVEKITRRGTNGAMIDPTRANMEEEPTPDVRTTVGKISAETM